MSNQKLAELHQSAAKCNEDAAKHNNEAAKHYIAGNLEKAGNHAHIADAHHSQAKIKTIEASKMHAENHISNQAK